MVFDNDEITLEELCGERKNILLLGRKEIGKTTVLHYLAKYCLCNFNALKSVPIIGLQFPKFENPVKPVGSNDIYTTR